MTKFNAKCQMALNLLERYLKYIKGEVIFTFTKDELENIVDVAKEIARITKELEGARRFLASLESKLSNEKFVSRAPEAVVNAEREKASKHRDLIVQLEQSLAAMEKLC